MTLGREPIRNGDVYCAPWCGFKCKWDAYEQAVIDASKLAKSLGEGWEPQVWENLGWHYKATTKDGRVNLHPKKDYRYNARVVGYTAFLSPTPSIGGKWVESGDTPQAALEAVRAKAQEELDGINLAMESLRRSLDKAMS